MGHGREQKLWSDQFVCTILIKTGHFKIILTMYYSNQLTPLNYLEGDRSPVDWGLGMLGTRDDDVINAWVYYYIHYSMVI